MIFFAGLRLVRLYEAKASAYEQLTDRKTALVNCDLIVQDVLQLYGQKETIAMCKLEVEFLGKPAEDLDGLTREFFPLCGKMFFPDTLKGQLFTSHASIKIAQKISSKFWENSESWFRCHRFYYSTVLICKQR